MTVLKPAMLVSIYLILFCGRCVFGIKEPSLTVAEADEYLRNHSRIFTPARVIDVTDGVYCAIGYGIGNMIMVEGTDGVIIIDTTESNDAGRAAYSALREKSNKPLKAIILTHFHADHITGARALLEDASQRGWKVNVYAHSSTRNEIARADSVYATRFRRAVRQFGHILVPNLERINCGLGLAYVRNRQPVNQTISPTHTYEDRKTFTVAGITFDLIHTPGETNDQTTVWIPEKKAFFPGDNIYQAFPNLYAIRGSPHRDVKSWYESMDFLKSLNAKYMVPSHTAPVTGEEEISDILTKYRDAIKFIYDQTVRYINKNYELGAIVDKVSLPPTLASHPYLLEFYGSVDWSIRTVYSGLLGWFDGDAANLNPLTKRERAIRMTNLINNATETTSALSKFVIAARNSLRISDANFSRTGYHLRAELQWALELATMAINTGFVDDPGYQEARQVKIDALAKLAVLRLSATERNYYLTVRKETQLNINSVVSPRTLKPWFETRMDPQFMAEYPLRFNAEICNATILLAVKFYFTDVGNTYGYTIRNCVANLEETRNRSYDVTVVTSYVLWRDIVVGNRDILSSYITGQIELKSKTWWGGLITLKTFLDLMDRDEFIA
uniref:uncharacterized protein LOC100178022 n=1 Tax=Ciona intestinalis TaxID=7719 RepID=UPI000180B473|nr:uncharacterized protein LOC100178022 [Ciona intestinalis]|eukprot:XP_002120065.1 uncharacterized protein LOC100178022 [Ciona intestinalis]